MLCLRCGKREQFADNLCESCILETVKPVLTTPVVSATVCPSCNRIKKKRSWEECPGDIGDAACQVASRSMSLLEGAKDPQIELSIVRSDSNTFHIQGKARSVYKGVLVPQDLKTEVRISYSQCSFCSKQSGNYFEAIIQIRGLSGLNVSQVDELLNFVNDSTESAHIKDPNVFVTKLEKVKGGYDFYMGDNSFARQMAQKLHEMYGGHHKTTSSLFGRKEGREIYRYTYLVRLPGFVVGDYLIRDNEPLKVEKISNKVHTRSLLTNREKKLDLDEAMSLRSFKKDEVEDELVIVSTTDDEVQVLHPTSMRTVVLLLNGRKAVGDTITGTLFDGELFLA